MSRSSDDVAISEPTSSLGSTFSPKSALQNDPISKPSVSNSALRQDCVDSILNFFSNADNETLLCVFALLVVVTYIILGRVGLLIIGVALGVILHASWEGPGRNLGQVSPRAYERRRELALELSKRLLDWHPHTASIEGPGENDGAVLVASEKLSASDLEYATFQPATAAALRAITDAVVEDYVKYWYNPIRPGESRFPGSCRRMLTHFVTAVSFHLSRKRTEDTFLQFLTNSSSIIIVFLNELAVAFSSVNSSSLEAKNIVERYLENSPNSSLADVLCAEQQRKKLNMIADDILSNFLDPTAYACSPVRDFLREVFAGIVLESTITSLSRPEFINQWIIYLLQDGESEIMHAIDAGVEGARNQGAKAKISDETTMRPPESVNNLANSQSMGHQPGHSDKATEEAIWEAKRLSALIASQDLQGTSPQVLALDGQLKDSRIPDAGQIPGASTHFVTNDLYSAAPSSGESPTKPEEAISFSTSPTADTAEVPQDDSTAPIILHCAQVMVDDDGAGSENGVIRSRPGWDYLIQIEPSSTRSTGWMVFRKYSDFQSLHEILGTVSRLNRVHMFSEKFPTLPTWKGKTRGSLARELERYLQEAMKHESLAETDRMRRFLEKESGPSDASTAKPGFSFPSPAAFENMGKGVLEALTNAPKGVAGSSRAVFDGVTGVFGGTNNARKSTNESERLSHSRKSSSVPIDIVGCGGSANESSPINAAFVGLDSCSPSITSKSSGKSVLPASPSPEVSPMNLLDELPKPPTINAVTTTHRDQGIGASEPLNPASGSQQSLKSNSSSGAKAGGNSDPTSPHPGHKTELSDGFESSDHDSYQSQRPITVDETQIAVELIFAVINELYTLSSAWNIRRTLLNAAKSYILRPGSPTLETIRVSLQESMIDSHTTDNALGKYLMKLRENALPTETELSAWPPPPTEQEKEQLRDTARRLFVQRGIPQALMSVMGAAASREALEKIFDSFQVENVARGFVFAVLLQGLRVLTL